MAGTDMTVVSGTIAKKNRNILAAEAKRQNRPLANLIKVILDDYASNLNTKGNKNDRD